MTTSGREGFSAFEIPEEPKTRPPVTSGLDQPKEQAFRRVARGQAQEVWLPLGRQARGWQQPRLLVRRA